MLQGLLQRTCVSVINTAQSVFVRQKACLRPCCTEAQGAVSLPKPREVKRINVHGWETRMSTPEGRRVLMRRILKGRHDISH